MAEEKQIDGSAVYGGCLTLLVSIPIMMVLRGFVLVQLFGWFGEPLLHFHLSLVSAMGLALISSVLSGYSKPKMTEKEEKEYREHPIAKSLWGLVMGLAWLGLAWGIGALVHWIGS